MDLGFSTSQNLRALGMAPMFFTPTHGAPPAAASGQLGVVPSCSLSRCAPRDSTPQTLFAFTQEHPVRVGRCPQAPLLAVAPAARPERLVAAHGRHVDVWQLGAALSRTEQVRPEHACGEVVVLAVHSLPQATSC